MGEVKETVKGSGPSKRTKLKKGENLIAHLEELRDLVSDLTAQKDEDAVQEGEDEKAENMRKAALLRATHSLLTACQRMLEDY